MHFAPLTGVPLRQTHLISHFPPLGPEYMGAKQFSHCSVFCVAQFSPVVAVPPGQLQRFGLHIRCLINLNPVARHDLHFSIPFTGQSLPIAGVPSSQTQRFGRHWCRRKLNVRPGSLQRSQPSFLSIGQWAPLVGTPPEQTHWFSTHLELEPAFFKYSTLLCSHVEENRCPNINFLMCKNTNRTAITQEEKNPPPHTSIAAYIHPPSSTLRLHYVGFLAEDIIAIYQRN